MTAALELISKVVAALGAVLGLAGYVLLIGAAIMWLRLHEAGLPPGVPVSLAGQEELIVIGAQAVAIWVALLTVFGGLAAWIVTGDPAERRFGYFEAGLALTMALSVLFALDSSHNWLYVFPGLAVLTILIGALVIWPSLNVVVGTLVPVAFAVGLGFALHFLAPGNEVVTSAGAVVIFGALVLLTPLLQRWRARQEATALAVARLSAEPDTQSKPLVAALEDKPAEHRPAAVLWAERAALAALFFLVLGVIAVTSQVDKQEDFHRALVSLTNGDCLEGSYVTRGKDQLVIAQPQLPAEQGETKKQKEEEEARTRVAVVPVTGILAVQVYGESEQGSPLTKQSECGKDALVRPAKASKSGGGAPGE